MFLHDKGYSHLVRSDAVQFSKISSKNYYDVIEIMMTLSSVRQMKKMIAERKAKIETGRVQIDR